jgi:transposase
MVARNYDVNANQVFGWRKRYRDDPRAPAIPAALQLIPVVVTGEQDAVVTQSSSASETIEIDLAGKYLVRISSAVDVQALRRGRRHPFPRHPVRQNRIPCRPCTF